MTSPGVVLTHRRAVALMVLVTLMWSIAGVVTRHLTQAHSFEVTFWRSFFTVLSLLVILPLWRGPRVFADLPWRNRLFWLSGFCWCVMFTAFMLALTLTSVANVLVTMAVAPLLTAVLARVFLGHRLALRTAVAIVVAGLGIAWMQSSQIGLARPDGDQGAGAWLGFAVAMCVPVAGAVQWTLMQHGQRRGARQGEAPPTDMVPCVLVGAVLSCLLTLPFSLPFQATGTDIGLLALLGLVQLAVPCVLSVLCATVLKAPELSLLQLLEVIFGILLAWVGAGEAPDATVLTGGALVIGALVFNEILAWRQNNG